MDAGAVLRAGCQILDPIMNRYGFPFVEGLSGQGSGGSFASGEYVRGDRRLELHFRHSLGLVTYHIGAFSLSHVAYMQALGKRGHHRYPGFSGDPLDGFRHLRHDLEHYCTDFLSGPGDAFRDCVAKAAEQAKVSGFLKLSG